MAGIETTRRPGTAESEVSPSHETAEPNEPTLVPAPPGIPQAVWLRMLQQRRAQQTANPSAPDRTSDQTAAATAAPETEAAQTAAPETSTASPTVQPKGSDRDVLSAEASRKLLQDAFGTWRTISAGDVRVLAQKDFEAAYDAIYGKTDYAWAKWVKPNHGNLNGFAYSGVNYINKDAANVTTVPHEMLHNNTASDWTPFVGSPFNEGATEYLEQYALRHGGIKTTLTHYPHQRGVVEAFLKSGVTDNQLFEAYLKGGASTIVGKWVDDHCKGKWADVKSATEKSNWATAKAYLALK